MIVNVGDENGENRHQHIESQTSVTNIDVTVASFLAYFETLTVGTSLVHDRCQRLETH